MKWPCHKDMHYYKDSGYMTLAANVVLGYITFYLEDTILYNPILQNQITSRLGKLDYAL